MDDICRLCCSTNFVNNHIFDEENALYLKMSLYLPIKVFKNDRLPQKICDKCSCKVNDFYQFCNETIEVQNRLRAILISTAVEVEDSVDLTLIKNNDLSPLPTPQGTEQTLNLDPSGVVHKTEPSEPITIDHGLGYNVHPKPELSTQSIIPTIERESRRTCEQSTQTDTEAPSESAINEINIDIPLYHNVKVKEEPKAVVPPVKMEDLFPPDNYYDEPTMQSDSEDNMSLSKYQKKKRKSKTVNGETERKRKPKLAEWEMLMRALPEGTALTVVDPQAGGDISVKQEPLDHPLGVDIKQMKSEPMEYHCCICFVQCYSRVEMLQHYKAHARDVEECGEPPAAPPPPDAEPLKCPRCQKTLERAAWGAHWARHWERDRRPYRCALCEKTFRDHHQILKHGVTHKLGEEGGGGGGGGGGGAGQAVRVRRVPRGVRVHAVPAGAPHARAPRGGGARARSALRRLRETVRAPQLAAAAPARALRPAQLPVQRVWQGALQPRASQVSHPHTHRIQAQCLQNVRQGVREEVQPDSARARALRGEAARVLALRQGVQPALHARHPRAIPQRRAPIRVRALRPRLRRQGAALHAPQDHLHIASPRPLRHALGWRLFALTVGRENEAARRCR